MESEEISEQSDSSLSKTIVVVVVERKALKALQCVV